MAELIELCTDLISESEKSDNPILLDSLNGLKNHRILKQAEDETLKALLKCINQMLNEPRTRTKGLMLLDNFLSQVESTRFIGFQLSFQSTLNLLTKCLDHDLTHRILVNVLPLCQKLPELNQTVISAVIPKLLSRFCENTKTTLPTHEEVSSILCCLERFRGPCGQYRFQIEKFLIPLVDSISVDDEEVFKQFSKLLPLLSGTGGGGNKGDKYSQDWYEIIMKLLENMHNCVVFLYSDVCPYIATENPYIVPASDSQNKHDNLILEKIRHPNVLMRISLTYRRLFNLAKLLSDFLIEPFPAPKPVPVRGILQLITNMMIINPVNILKNSSAGSSTPNESVIPKENIHLAALLPSIHKCALDVLKKLILSCDVQLFSEGARIELLILQQLKWIVEHQGSFEILKCQLYSTVESWLKITNGSITSNKNATLLVQEIIQDIKIEKHSVSLSLSNSKGKKGSHKKQQTANLVTASKNVSTKEAEVKSERVCSAALKCLLLVIPSLDFASYRAVYIILATTIGDFIQSAEQFPSPYDSTECRTQAFKTLTQMILNPHPKSPISVGLINSLLELGSRDPDHNVSSECHNCLSMVERIIHPSYGTLQFPQVNIPLTTTPFTNDQLQYATRNEEEQEEEEQINEEDQEDDKINDADDDESMIVDEIESNKNKQSSQRKSINSNNNNNSFHQSEEDEEEEVEDEDGKIIAEDEERPSSSSFLNMSTRSTTSLVDTSFIKDCVAQALKESLSELGLMVGKSQQNHSYSSNNNYSHGPPSPLLDNDGDSLNGYDDGDGDESTIFTDSGSDRLIHINRIVSTPVDNGNMDHIALVKDIENNKSSRRFNTSDTIEPPMKKVKTWKTGLINGNGNHEDYDNDEDDETGMKKQNKSNEDDVHVTVQEILLDFDDSIVFQE